MSTPPPMLHMRVPNLIEKEEILTFTSPNYKESSEEDSKLRVYTQNGRVWLSGRIYRNGTGTTTGYSLNLGITLPEWARPTRYIKIGGVFAGARGVIIIKPDGNLDIYMYGQMTNGREVPFEGISWPAP